MAAKYRALLTTLGASKLSSAVAEGDKLEITSMAVGDGGGVSPVPDPAQTKLVGEVYRAPLNSLSISKNGDNQIAAELIIPESRGGWWIREMGLYDDDGDLIAVANCPESYKSTVEQGSGRTQVIRMILVVSSTDAVVLKVDPSVVVASRQYVDDAITASLVPAGIPLPWPTDIPPAGHAVMLGQAFDPVKYPQLAFAYPGGVLPDMREQTVKGKPDGRDVLSYELDGVKAHGHDAEISDADLGTVISDEFDYGSKTTSEDGEHTHALTASVPTTKSNSKAISGGSVGVWTGGLVTTAAGQHTHVIEIGPHGHTFTLGPHGHGITVKETGNLENTVKNIAFNYIVRLA
ncbi:phage tail-collar fiber domain-containing protein [Kluyvera georgiana]|uniref:phage tail-collar fiber domain-containing protein n=1 Tax=Kluyvera georgiana TaxID=73098 RepID=UPI003F66D4F3